jgi:hypothetical protein
MAGAGAANFGAVWEPSSGSFISASCFGDRENLSNAFEEYDMRAEISHDAEQVRQSLALLRRRL